MFSDLEHLCIEIMDVQILPTQIFLDRVFPPYLLEHSLSVVSFAAIQRKIEIIPRSTIERAFQPCLCLWFPPGRLRRSKVDEDQLSSAIDLRWRIMTLVSC